MTPTLEEILNAVSVETGIDTETLKSRSREANVNMARQIYFYIAREETTRSYREVGSIVNRDHATVLYAHRKLADTRFITDKEQNTINGVQKLLREPVVEMTYLQTALLGKAYNYANNHTFNWAIQALRDNGYN